MYHIKPNTSRTISYDRYGGGPPLVLVHGAFSDHVTNWEFVKPEFERHFTTYAIARPGRGETPSRDDRSVDDEAGDVVELLRSIGEPAFLLGHSYGAHVALAAAAAAPDRVRKLVLYEAPWNWIVSHDIGDLAAMAADGDWEAMSMTFFHRCLKVPQDELDALRATESWKPVLDDAPHGLRDLQSLAGLSFDPVRFRGLDVPVQLQVGTESPRGLYVTDALATCLPNAEIKELSGQAHEGMTTAPEMYAQVVVDFLLGAADKSLRALVSSSAA